MRFELRNVVANYAFEKSRRLAHIMPNVYAVFDDRHVNNYMGPSAQKHTISLDTELPISTSKPSYLPESVRV